jgi:hypothetical protein
VSQFKFKNLPKGFEFPFTRTEIREFVKTSPANFELVEFGGISSSEALSNERFRHLHDWNWVCSLKTEFRETEWVFWLEVTGVRSKRFQERREEVARELLAEITKWVEGKIALTVTAPKKPCRAHISFVLTPEADEIARLSEWD